MMIYLTFFRVITRYSLNVNIKFDDYDILEKQSKQLERQRREIEMLRNELNKEKENEIITRLVNNSRNS